MKYEVMILAKPLTNEDIRDKVLAKVEKKVNDSKGSLTIKDYIGKRMLAYPVKKFKEGVYILCTIELVEAKINDLKKEMSLMGDVLRYLVLKADNI
jgi:small subunit ribosomal protein S6